MPTAVSTTDFLNCRVLGSRGWAPTLLVVLSRGYRNLLRYHVAYLLFFEMFFSTFTRGLVKTLLIWIVLEKANGYKIGFDI